MKYNLQNLKANTERTPSERKQLAIKAGKASGKKRKENATIKGVFLSYLQGKDKATNLTGAQKIAFSCLQQAENGNIKAIQFIAEICGEYKQNTEITANIELQEKNKQLTPQQAMQFLADLEKII